MREDYDLDQAIRKIPDFPKPGVLFYDITGILADPHAFDFCVARALSLFETEEYDAVAAIESRGFVFAAPIAHACGAPLMIIRKKGKLPGPTYSKKFSLEYGEDEIEVHKSDLKKSMRVLLVDDLIATGGTLRAAAELIGQGEATVIGIFAVVGLPFLRYDRLLSGYRTETLIDYQGE